MKNSATDRIRAKLADAHPLSDSGDAPAIANASAPASGVIIDEDYLDSLFGSSKSVAAEPDHVSSQVAEMEAEAVLYSEQDYSSSEAATLEEAASGRSYEDANSEPVDYEATEETAASLELLAFHAAVENDVAVVEEPAAIEEVPEPPVVTARQEPVAPPASDKSRVVRIAPASARQPQKISGKSRSFDRNQRQNQNQNPPQTNQQAAAPPPPVQSRQQTVAPAVNRVPSPAPAAPVVAAPVVVAPTAVESAAPAPNKNRMLMIAAAAVMVVGGGAAMMWKGAPKSEPQTQAPPQTSQPAPATTANALPPEPVPVPTAQPTTPPVVAAVDQSKALTADKSKAPPIETAAQQPVTAVRAAPKQFVAPTVQTSRPATTNTLVAEAAPELSMNVQGGTIALPAATIAGRVPAPPVAPKADTPAPTATNQNPAPPPAAVKASPAQVSAPLVATLTRIKTVSPEYPATARAAKIGGVVAFSVTVGKDGKVASLRPISGNPMLLPSARNAISQWVYSPPMVNGQPTEATTVVQLTFNLK